MRFEDYNINYTLKKNLAKLEFRKPTDIQFKAIPYILKGEDVLAIAQTGTGKTAAFAIPILDILHKRKINRRTDGIKCIVMVPTRELAIQITEVFQHIGRNTRIKPLSIFGGVDQDPQIAKLEDGVDILITTPGRLFDLVSQGHLKLHRVEILVLDEADHMLDLGFIKDIRDLIRFLPKKRQTLFFSATIDEKIKKLAYSLVHNPIRIQVSPKNPVAKNINHAVMFINMDDKRFFLERVINEHPDSKILVFVRTKVRAERVAKALLRVDVKSKTIHGSKEQADRLAVLNEFKNDQIKVLIATDVTARGIDIPNVDFVINYDLPEKSDNYVHRCGRTGRGFKKGDAYSFCDEKERPLLAAIEEYTGSPIRILDVTKDDYKDTLDLSDDSEFDINSLMKDTADLLDRKKKGKTKKKKNRKGRNGQKR